jgi:hypothetical protein
MSLQFNVSASYQKLNCRTPTSTQAFQFLKIFHDTQQSSSFEILVIPSLIFSLNSCKVSIFSYIFFLY